MLTLSTERDVLELASIGHLTFNIHLSLMFTFAEFGGNDNVLLIDEDLPGV